MPVLRRRDEAEEGADIDYLKKDLIEREAIPPAKQYPVSIPLQNGYLILHPSKKPTTHQTRRRERLQEGDDKGRPERRRVSPRELSYVKNRLKLN